MVLKGLGESLKTIRLLAVGTDAYGKATQKSIVKYQVMRGLLGPIVDLMYEMTANVRLLTEVLAPNAEAMEKTEEAASTLVKPLDLMVKSFRAIAMGLLFLVGMFITVTAVLITFTGSFAGATEAFPAFYEGLGDIYNSVMSVVDSLMQIGAVILSLDFGPLLEAGAMLFGGLIMLVVSFAAAFYGFIADIMSSLVTLFTYMESSGAFQAIINGISGIIVAFTMAFSYIFKILDALGINWTSIFGLISGVFNGFIEFLINSGLLDFFAELIEVIGFILPPAVFVIGEILVLFASLIGFLAGPVFDAFEGVISIIVNVLAGAIALAVVSFRLAFAAITAVVEIFIAIFSGNFSAIPDIVFGFLGKAKGIFVDFGESLKSIFVNIIDAILKPFGFAFDDLKALVTTIFDGIESVIMGFIDAVRPPLEAIFGFVGDVVGGVGDAIGGVVGGAGDFLGSINPFHSGGISTGPASGYPATLHGTEAVVPLPDGSSIPVTLKGMGGGGGENITVNISVSGGGNAREVARAVSQEVQRVFRNRSRGSGFGRGTL
jgi:phage-related protein